MYIQIDMYICTFSIYVHSNDLILGHFDH